MSDTGICVAHLVRASNGIATIERFLSSYERHPAGLEHELLFILKGFGPLGVGRDVDSLLGRFRHHRVVVPDFGYDITAYFRAARKLEFPCFMFINSHSEILADGWLMKLHRALQSGNVGVAGATGSYGGFHVDEEKMLHRESVTIRGPWKRLLLRLPGMEALNSVKRRLLFPRFPNPHVRSNAFLIRRETLMRLRPQFTPTKFQAYRFESGSRSMTRQVLDMDQSAVVVGRDGSIHDVGQWRGARIFWEADQENLLIADNQTRRYQESAPEAKNVFAWQAWGINYLGAARR